MCSFLCFWDDSGMRRGSVTRMTYRSRGRFLHGRVEAASLQANLATLRVEVRCGVGRDARSGSPRVFRTLTASSCCPRVVSVVHFCFGDDSHQRDARHSHHCEDRRDAEDCALSLYCTVLPVLSNLSANAVHGKNLMEEVVWNRQTLNTRWSTPQRLVLGQRSPRLLALCSFVFSICQLSLTSCLGTLGASQIAGVCGLIVAVLGVGSLPEGAAHAGWAGGP